MPPRKRPVQEATPRAAAPADPSQHLSGFIHYLKAECGLSQNTILAYRRDLTRFDAWYREHGPSRLQLVDLGLLTKYLEDLHQHQYAATSMARHLVSLKMFFRYLVLEGILPESVAELVNSPKLWQHLPKVLSVSQKRAIFACSQRGADNASTRLPQRQTPIEDYRVEVGQTLCRSNWSKPRGQPAYASA